jgi:hypothetical protein
MASATFEDPARNIHHFYCCLPLWSNIDFILTEWPPNGRLGHSGKQTVLVEVRDDPEVRQSLSPKRSFPILSVGRDTLRFPKPSQPYIIPYF